MAANRCEAIFSAPDEDEIAQERIEHIKANADLLNSVLTRERSRDELKLRILSQLEVYRENLLIYADEAVENNESSPVEISDDQLDKIIAAHLYGQGQTGKDRGPAALWNYSPSQVSFGFSLLALEITDRCLRPACPLI